MKIDFKKIINIKNVSDLKDYILDTPIFHSNYLFHYLILINNLDGLKLQKFPIYIENSDGGWWKQEFDSNNNRIYHENSKGEVIDKRNINVNID